MIKLIYIGNRFYSESGTVMSPIYTEAGERYDFGFAAAALANGEEISIRQATPEELVQFNTQLTALKAKKS